MASTIVRSAILHFNFTGPIVVDLSCYAIALEIVPSTEDVDIGTMCAPSLTTQGRTTFSALAAFLWEPALYTALQPHIGESMLVAFAPDATKNTEYIKFGSRYAAQPWGRFEIGQRVEVELPLAVLDVPLWNIGPMALVDDAGQPVSIWEEPATLPAPEPAPEPAPAAPEA
jgi:hypothetical protein